MSTVRVRPGTLPKLLWVNDLREFLYYAGIGVLPRFWARKCLKSNANSENSRKIAAKISAGYVKIYNFEMFTKWYNILTKNMPILCGIYQILALSAEYRLFFCSSNWHFEYLQYNSNWYFEKQLFLSELSIYYNRNHILSSKSVIFYTFFFYRTWLRDFKNLVRNIYLTVNQTDTSLFRNMFLCSITFRFHTCTSFRTSCTNTMRISASTCRYSRFN